MKLSTLLSWIKGKFETHETLNFDDVFTVKDGFIVSSAEVYRRGKRIYARILFSGAATSSATGNIKCLTINSAYKKKIAFSGGCMINVSTAGQVYGPAVVASIGNDIEVCTGKTNTTFGNNTYPWCTTSALRFEYELA